MCLIWAILPPGIAGGKVNTGGKVMTGQLAGHLGWVGNDHVILCFDIQ